MFTARTTRALGVALAGLATAACSDPGRTFEFPPTDVVYEGDLIRIRAAPGLEPCGGTGRSMEAMLQLLIADTGLGDLESPIDVYWLNPQDVRASSSTTKLRCSTPEHPRTLPNTRESPATAAGVRGARPAPRVR